jgi:membrane protease YdiL (CAAX protease family)
VKLPDGGAFLLATLVFVVWHYFLSAAALRRFTQKWQRPVDAWAGPMSRAIGGAMLLAVSLVAATGSLAPAGWFAAPASFEALLWVAIPASILVPVVWRAGREPAQQARYPDFRVPNASRRDQLLSAASWLTYLVGYEALFRGLILGLCVQVAGLETGLAIHTALYVLAHLHKDAAETIGCIPTGYLFGYMTVHTESLWPAIILHVVIAIAAEQSAGRSNPALQWR